MTARFHTSDVVRTVRPTSAQHAPQARVRRHAEAHLRLRRRLAGRGGAFLKTPAVIVLLAGLSASGCTFFIGRGTTTSPSASTGAAGAPASPAATASHEQLCSQLRADIASSEHNQRSTAPASNTAIIAAASEGKEDQKIEALRKRYAQMGCVGNPPPAGNAARP